MVQATVRVTDETREILREIAKSEGVSMQAVLEHAVEEYRRQRFLERVNTSYASLRKDRAAWSENLAESADWDATLNDGLPEDEQWDNGSRVPSSK